MDDGDFLISGVETRKNWQHKGNYLEKRTIFLTIMLRNDHQDLGPTSKVDIIHAAQNLRVRTVLLNGRKLNFETFLLEISTDFPCCCDKGPQPFSSGAFYVIHDIWCFHSM